MLRETCIGPQLSVRGTASNVVSNQTKFSIRSRVCCSAALLSKTMMLPLQPNLRNSYSCATLIWTVWDSNFHGVVEPMFVVQNDRRD